MGPRYVRLLEEIDRHGSIREACVHVGLSYRTCLNRVRQMERVLGHGAGYVRANRGVANGSVAPPRPALPETAPQWLTSPICSAA